MYIYSFNLLAIFCRKCYTTIRLRRKHAKRESTWKGIS